MLEIALGGQHTSEGCSATAALVAATPTPHVRAYAINKRPVHGDPWYTTSDSAIALSQHSADGTHYKAQYTCV